MKKHGDPALRIPITFWAMQSVQCSFDKISMANPNLWLVLRVLMIATLRVLFAQSVGFNESISFSIMNHE